MATKITLSPAKALLLLMQKYHANALLTAKLKSWYFLGIQSKQDESEINKLFQDEIFNDYIISDEKKIINEDSAKRFFETHFAYETIVNNTDKLKVDELEQLKANIIDSFAYAMPDLEHVLNGELDPKDDDICKEYATYIAKLNEGIFFREMSPEKIDKIRLILQISFLAVTNTNLSLKPLPIDIYGQGIYSKEQRGKEIIKGQESTRSDHRGILKNYMPAPNDGVVYTPSDMPILKPSDQATYVEGAAFVEHSFKQKVHPFSNSISGTVLALLRTLAALKQDNTVVYTDSAQMMSQYLQLSMVTMLYLTGGHSLYEFIAPLSLPEVREEFKEMKGFENISLESLFYTGNEEAFHAALTRTLEYNQRILQQAAMRDELGELSPRKTSVEALKPIEFNLTIGQVLERITAAKEIFDERIKSEFFSSLRAGSRQNLLIQEHLSNVQTCLLEKNIDGALSAINLLENKLRANFSSNSFFGFGPKNSSFQLVESLQQSLNRLQESESEVRNNVEQSDAIAKGR